MGGVSTHTWGRLWPFTARGNVCWDCRGQGAGKVDGTQGMEDRYCKFTGFCPGTIILVCSSKRGQAAIGSAIRHHHTFPSPPVHPMAGHPAAPRRPHEAQCKPNDEGIIEVSSDDDDGVGPNPYRTVEELCKVCSYLSSGHGPALMSICSGECRPPTGPA